MILPDIMNAMVLEKQGEALYYKQVPLPYPQSKQVLVKVVACGVCRTDLHILDGELSNPKLPLIPGHEIIGRVVSTGDDVSLVKTGDFIGIPWLGYTCGKCKYCLQNKENLCENALFTGYTLNGGYAEYTVADERYCFGLSSVYANAAGAPLLCAGLIGYRCYKMMGENISNIGLYGFGAAAHIVIQMAVFQNKKVFAFTREGDVETQKFATKLGAVWAGASNEAPPCMLDAAIIFAPAGNLVPAALRNVDKGGVVVCGGIHMSDIPSFPYNLLWGERIIRSVANLTRKDGEEFLKLAPAIPVKTETQLFNLQQANEALEALRKGHIQGAAVLIMP
ncbi:zinc-dependent alcohol dehydrogenase family protein [Segetibacter koreensis]|uniref:zinc-dependent alcohol dehydrogenase family protein n=1 Tax=Segetibacter koreensis TaxID=398037 RepID=UPI00037AE1C9|nr:zinc-dependent alcohol dehydrogenase family protein [Segetibacter koreensis]